MMGENERVVGQSSNAIDAFATNVVSNVPIAVLSAEEERLWSIVKANSSDFNAWTSLVEDTEKVSQDNILKIRKLYDAFLAEFPLCCGYWKKYADHEARFGAIDKVIKVYERAVEGVTYSVDIWLHYCAFVITTYGDPDTVRRLFERALAYVGTDYLSYPLWDKYIEYEYMQQQWGHLAMIYTRILANPNQQLDRYLTGFKELAGSKPLTELRSAEVTTAAGVTANSDVDGKGNENENDVEAMDNYSKPVSAGSTEAEELGKYIAIREEIYKKTKEFDSKISGFETAIRRPYFSIRSLNDAELENWHNYLDFTESDGDFYKVFKLYERCLVACANYPEFWIRYILFMESSGNINLAENALARATQVFVKRQPEIHLFAAHFKEQCGDIPGVRASYQLVHTEISPGFLEAIIEHANMERRLGNVEDAFSLYEQAIAIEQGKEHSSTLPMLFARYSRFVYLVTGNVEKARDILDRALEHVQLLKPLLEALIYLGSIQSLSKRIEHIDSLVDKFIRRGPDNADAATVHEKEELSSIYLEFVDLFGDAHSIKKAKDRHARLFLCHKGTSKSRKRHADDCISSEEKIAKTCSGVPSTAQNQCPSGHGSQPQPCPLDTQVEGQPDNNTGHGKQQVPLQDFGGDDVDYSGRFATSQIFPTYDDAVGWAKQVATEVGFVLVKSSYKPQRPSGRVLAYLRCNRGLKYRGQNRDLNTAVRKNTKTKACGCRFMVKVVERQGHAGWVMVTDSNTGKHNHELIVYEGQRKINGLSPAAKKLVRDLSEAQMKPGNILAEVKEKFQENNVNIRHIYNYLNKLRKGKSEGNVDL